MNEQEMDIFKIISAAGDSRGSAFEALRLPAKGNCKPKQKCRKPKKSIDAHDVQTKLITGKSTAIRRNEFVDGSCARPLDDQYFSSGFDRRNDRYVKGTKRSQGLAIR